MKKYKVILLDMDGVVCSFVSAVVKQLNKVTGQTVTPDQVVAASTWQMESLWGLSQKDWWDAIDQNPNFWLEIPMLPWAKDLHNRLKHYGNEVVILTSPSQNPVCIAHKLIWLKENMNIPSRNVITGKKKYLLARSDALLVDDSPANCEEFIKNGGNAACVPSDWNKVNLTIEDVWREIGKFL